MGAGACRAEGACPALQSPDFVLKVLGSVFWELAGFLLGYRKGNFLQEILFFDGRGKLSLAWKMMETKKISTTGTR